MIAYIFTFFLSFLPIQEPQLSIQNSYKEFYDIIDKMERDNPKAFPYINLLIKKAKTEKNIGNYIMHIVLGLLLLPKI